MTANHYSLHLRTMWSSVPETFPIGVATPASKHIGVVGGIVTRPIPALDDVRFWQIVLQKSFCGMGLKFSEAWARRLNNDVGDHVATRQTHRRFWQRLCGSIERRLSLVSFFGGNFVAAAFWTFATKSAPNSHYRAVARMLFLVLPNRHP